MLCADIPRKIAVRQIPAFPANRKAAIEKILAGMAEQHIIIRFKPDLPARTQKGFVLIKEGAAEPFTEFHYKYFSITRKYFFPNILRDPCAK